MIKYLLYPIIFLTSFYSLQFQDVDGNTVGMNTYQNKKVLIVNIATESPRKAQIGELQALQQSYADSLIVIAFPSNSFGNEPRTNSEIKQHCQATYNVTYKIASKSAVSGSTAHVVFNWLANASENGAVNGAVIRDFQKFLIDKDGSVIGSFAPSVSPMDSVIQNAILGN